MKKHELGTRTAEVYRRFENRVDCADLMRFLGLERRLEAVLIYYRQQNTMIHKVGCTLKGQNSNKTVRPENPKTYRGLYDLMTKVLTPFVDQLNHYVILCDLPFNDMLGLPRLLTSTLNDPIT